MTPTTNGFALKLTAHPRIPLSLRRKLARLCFKLDGREFTVEIHGRPFSGTLDNYIEWVVFTTRDYFEYTYLNLVRSLVSGGTALDVGANIGNHTHAFAGFFDEVLSFEPFDRVAVRLEQKAALLPNVSVFRVALSDRDDTLRFARPDTANWGKGKISAEGDIEVPVVVGDAFIVGKHTRPVNFIKVDVEGHEMAVLRGLRETIARDRPVVMFEVPKALRQGHDGGLTSAYSLFPADYHFVAFRGQSTFPLQRDTAGVVPVDKSRSRLQHKITYLLGYGPERGFRLEGGSLRRG